VWLAVLAVVFSLIGAFYYVRIVKVMYFDEPTQAVAIEPQPAASATMAVNGLAVLLLGILPGPLMAACLVAIQQALAT
jgi:NADH-quinone oxidoreductase subunit N